MSPISAGVIVVFICRRGVIFADRLIELEYGSDWVTENPFDVPQWG